MAFRSVPFALVALLSGSLASVAFFVSCSDPAPTTPPVKHHEAGPGDHFCDLAGSLQFTPAGMVQIDGGPAAPDLSWMTLPTGFCAHYFGQVGNARQLRFAPSGELFVASPKTPTTGGCGACGLALIAVLPDDDGDGFADAPTTFLGSLPSTQGMLFANGYFYYQDHSRILRVPYKAGDRTAQGTAEQVVDIQVFVSGLHWPKTLDQADDGTIYVGNGADEGDPCLPGHPFRGGVLKIDGSPNGAQVAKGFRNPIAIRCLHGKNLCFAIELAKDYSGNIGGREKLVPIHDGDDWGFPCCATKDLPYQAGMGTDCSTTMADDVGFLIGDTPFGVDFDDGKWPAPFTRDAFVTLHGEVTRWQGAKIVAIQTDPKTGLPLPGTTATNGEPSGAMTSFATGWDDGTKAHGRPGAIVFAPDGRLFIGNDADGSIIWIAPMDL